MTLPDDFQRRIRETFGEAGDEWLAALPALLQVCADRWVLTIGGHFPLSYNYVTPARRADGAEVVVKAGVPHANLRSEIAALRHFDGRAVVRLIDAAEDAGVMLLERVVPGTTLDAEVEDDAEATSIAADLMRQMWRPPPHDHDFPTIGDWAQAPSRIRSMYDGGSVPLPSLLVEMAESLLAELLVSSAASVLLHGDLHHENILRGERERWLVIDPKGVVGDPAFEVGAFLLNPMSDWPWQPAAAARLHRRIDIFAEQLGIDRERLVKWGVAVSVLSACWSVEDHGEGWEHAMKVAELLADELP